MRWIKRKRQKINAFFLITAVTVTNPLPKYFWKSRWSLQLSKAKLASMPSFWTNILQLMIAGRKMAEVMAKTRTRRKRTLQTIKTNFLLMFKEPWRRMFV